MARLVLCTACERTARVLEPMPADRLLARTALTVAAAPVTTLTAQQQRLG